MAIPFDLPSSLVALVPPVRVPPSEVVKLITDAYAAGKRAGQAELLKIAVDVIQPVQRK
jgi:hypothetical protein